MTDIQLPPLPNHPEPRTMRWSELEKMVIEEYARSAIREHEARRVPSHITVTEEMHVAAINVLARADGNDGLPQQMMDAMLASAPPAPQASVVKQEPFGYVSQHINGQYLFSKTIAGVYRDTAVSINDVYTHPAPVREPLADDFAKWYWQACDSSDPHHWMKAALAAQRILATSKPEADHGITKDTPKFRRKASADFDLPAPNDNIEDTP